MTKIYKIDQMAVKQTEWPLNKPTSSIARPSKIYPKWDIWFENMPSGNPEHDDNIGDFFLIWQRGSCWTFC
jgi:hypothetical protein